MKKYFSSGFFSNINSLTIAIQRAQPELLGVSERRTATGTKIDPPLRHFSQELCSNYDIIYEGGYWSTPLRGGSMNFKVTPLVAQTSVGDEQVLISTKRVRPFV